MCHTGTRSHTVVKWLKSQGYHHSVNVLGGIDAWAALIDRSIKTLLTILSKYKPKKTIKIPIISKKTRKIT